MNACQFVTISILTMIVFLTLITSERILNKGLDRDVEITNLNRCFRKC